MEEGKKIKVMVLGSTGMLGHMVTKILLRNPLLDVSVDTRSHVVYEVINGVKTYKVRANEPLTYVLETFDYVINCILANNTENREMAAQINAVFPNKLAEFCPNSKIISISTDAVFDSPEGNYDEKTKVCPSDFYGCCKVVGENTNKNVTNLRVSLVGPEIKNQKSLLAWFFAQPKEKPVKGYTNHIWNGVTTLALAKIIQGVITEGIKTPNLLHIVPADSVSKFELLSLFNEIFNKGKQIVPVKAVRPINRKLATLNGELNEKLWGVAGYSKLPTIKELIIELRDFQENELKKELDGAIVL
jgi:dTDP-4-dehydrorhamnose reductase